MVELVALWEKGWLDARVEAFIWRQMADAFAVDRLTFVPARLNQERPNEAASVPDALAASSCRPVFLIPRGGVSLVEYEHPEDAVYVFGNAQDGNERWSCGHDVVSIETKRAIDFFAVDAAAIVLYDRLVKRGN